MRSSYSSKRGSPEMSTNRRSDETVAYYERLAPAFVEDTLNVHMEPLYGPFLRLIPEGGDILDAGCGSGRDAREFKRRGYKVTAIDASPAIARLAGEIIGQTVEVVRFEEMTYKEAFDAVWACASLLHVPAFSVDEVFGRLARAVRTGGVLYVSFKFGEGQEVKDGRLFCHHTEESLREVLRRHPCLELLRTWKTQDGRPERTGESWLNALLRKVETSIHATQSSNKNQAGQSDSSTLQLARRPGRGSDWFA